MYARILTRVCSGTEDDETVAQVADELGACKGSRLDCEVAACESLRPSEERRCDSLALTRATALEQLRAELDVVVRKNRP